MWLALKLLASGAFDAVLRGLSAAAKWLFADWRNGPLVICAAMWAVHALIIVPEIRKDWRDTAAQLEAAQLAHLGTIDNFIDASDEAQREAEANVVRVRFEQETINREVTSDLRSDLAAVTARFNRLRARNGARTDPGRADPADLPAAGGTAARTAGAPGDPDLRAAGGLTAQPLCPAGLVCLTIDEAEQASQDAHLHNRLIDWVLAQSAVRFMPEGSQ